MIELDTALLAWLNAGHDTPLWLVQAARFLSRELPSLVLAGLIGAWLVGNGNVRALDQPDSWSRCIAGPPLTGG